MWFNDYVHVLSQVTERSLFTETSTRLPVLEAWWSSTEAAPVTRLVSFTTWARTTTATRWPSTTPPPPHGSVRRSGTVLYHQDAGPTVLWVLTMAICSYLVDTMGNYNSIFPYLTIPFIKDAPRSIKMTCGYWTQTHGPGPRWPQEVLDLIRGEDKLWWRWETNCSCLEEPRPTTVLLSTSHPSSWPCCPSRRRTPATSWWTTTTCSSWTCRLVSKLSQSCLLLITKYQLR